MAIGGGVKIQWCPSVDPAATGYYIYYGSGPVPSGWTAAVYSNNVDCPAFLISKGANYFRAYTNKIDAGTPTTYAISNLVEGKTYFFAVVAYDTNLVESDYSEETMYTVPISPATNVPPSAPQGLKVFAN